MFAVLKYRGAFLGQFEVTREPQEVAEGVSIWIEGQSLQVQWHRSSKGKVKIEQGVLSPPVMAPLFGSPYYIGCFKTNAAARDYANQKP